MERRTAAEARQNLGGFTERYGAWALVAGASEGLGAAFARALAARGMDLVVVARRTQVLAALAEELRARDGVEVRCLAGDLAEEPFLERLCASLAGLDLGLVVYNAAHAPVGDFACADPASLLRAVDVNVRAPVVLLKALVPGMVARGRGAVVLMSSLAGNQGSPWIATYAATKAFLRVLAEGLWSALRGRGIDVVACSAGAVRTPGYAQAAAREAPGTLDPAEVVERTLRSLGRGPVVIPGLVNRAASFVLGRLLGRRAAIGLMAGITGGLQGAPGGEGKT